MNKFKTARTDNGLQKPVRAIARWLPIWAAAVIGIIALSINYVILSPSSVSASTPNPLAGLKLGPFGNENASYNDDIAPVITQWNSTRPTDAAKLKKIYTRPISVWFGENWAPTTNVATIVNGIVTAQTAANRVAVFTVYSIPNRDCGSYSAGGSTPESYIAWITAFAQGLGGRKSVILLEPDSLAQAGCLAPADYATRISLINQALDLFKAQNAVVYLDSGNARWLSSSTAISRLQAAGVARADGFMLNAANFYSNTETITYGNTISAGVAGKHFVIDTSRNGNGPYLYNGTTSNGATLQAEPLAKPPRLPPIKPTLMPTSGSKLRVAPMALAPNLVKMIRLPGLLCQNTLLL